MWCRDCQVCATDGCYDACGLSGVVAFFFFIGVMVLCVVFSAGLITVLLMLNSKYNAGARPALCPRMGLIVVSLITGIPIVAAHFFSTFERSGTGQFNLLPPCNTAWTTLGVWASSSNRVPTDSFLEPCPKAQSQFRAFRAFLVLALLMAVLVEVTIFLVRDVRKVMGVMFVTALFLLCGIIIESAIWSTDDFCGSGHSLAGLKYERATTLNCMIAAICMYGISIGMYFLQRILCPRHAESLTGHAPLSAEPSPEVGYPEVGLYQYPAGQQGHVVVQGQPVRQSEMMGVV